jgi:hypothetical protein
MPTTLDMVAVSAPAAITGTPREHRRRWGIVGLVAIVARGKGVKIAKTDIWETAAVVKLTPERVSPGR